MFKAGPGQTLIRIYVQPGAKNTEIVGMHDDCLKIRVASPPVDGKANKELINFLSKELRIPKSRISVAKGASSRRKTVVVEGVDPKRAEAILCQKLDAPND